MAPPTGGVGLSHSEYDPEKDPLRRAVAASSMKGNVVSSLSGGCGGEPNEFVAESYSDAGGPPHNSSVRIAIFVQPV